MVSVTGVLPAPAAREDGEKVAIAPGGKPLTVRLIAVGKATPEGLTSRL